MESTIFLCQEVAEQLSALFGQDGLGVVLDALGGELAVAQPHHHAAAASCLLQAVGKLVADDERVVAPDDEAATQPAEDRAPVVLDRRRLAVDRVVQLDLAAERLGERLVSEAYAERRHARLRKAPDEIE